MSALIPFAQSAGLPAHLADIFGEGGNIGAKVSTNQMSFKGKIWRIVIDGEEKKLEKQDEAGDIVPVQIINVVVLDHNKRRSRTFFEGGYEEGKATAPTCFSNDGDKPDASVKDKQCATCAACPQAVKGSKITENNKQTTACSPVKRIAIVPRNKLNGEFPPLLLKLAQTSIWDKTNPEESKGWYAWDQYLDMLRARGAKHTAMVETRVKFDASTAYPKLLFSAAGWLDGTEVVAAKALIDSQADVISNIINGAASEDGVSAGAPVSKAETSDEDDGGAAKAAADAKKAEAAAVAEAAKKAKEKADKVAAAKAALAALEAAENDDGDAGEGDAGEGDEAAAAEAARVAAEAAAAKKAADAAAAKKKKADAAKAAAAAALAAAEADDGGVTDVESKPVETKPAAKPAATTESATPASLSALLSGWDDD